MKENKKIKYILPEGAEISIRSYIDDIIKRNGKGVISEHVKVRLYALVKSWQPKIISKFDVVELYKKFMNVQEVSSDIKTKLELVNKHYKMYNAMLQVNKIHGLADKSSRKKLKKLTSENYLDIFISSLKEQLFYSEPLNEAADYDLDEINETALELYEESLYLVEKENAFFSLIDSVNKEFYEHVLNYCKNKKIIKKHASWLDRGLSDIDKLILQNLPLDSLVKLFISLKKTSYYLDNHGQQELTQKEESILGDIIFSIETLVYDNAMQNSLEVKVKVHDNPLPVQMVFVPAAILSDKNHADYKAIVINFEIEPFQFIEFYKKKLYAAFKEINNQAKSEEKEVLVTVPVIGASEFLRYKFSGVEILFEYVLIEVLKECYEFSCIKGVVFDPNEKNIPDSEEFIGRIKYYRLKSSQLCSPEFYDEYFAGCSLATLVSSDSRLLPGGAFYNGKRKTDEGLKAALSDLFQTLTGRYGFYNEESKEFSPLDEGVKWGVMCKLSQDYTVSLLSGDKDASPPNLDQELCELNKHSEVQVFKPQEFEEKTEEFRMSDKAFDQVPVDSSVVAAIGVHRKAKKRSARVSEDQEQQGNTVRSLEEASHSLAVFEERYGDNGGFRGR
jgi:hypothetical protein